MFKEILDIVRGEQPHRDLVAGFDEMLRNAVDLTHEGMRLFWLRPVDKAALEALSRRDVELNKFERTLRKNITVDVAVHGDYSVTPLLALMSLVKDAERLGDYAKNLARLGLLCERLPDDEIVASLRDISTELSQFLSEVPDVLRRDDSARATELTRQGRQRQRAIKDLLPRIASGNMPPDATTCMALGSHYHKRLQGHGLNVLSSLIMPLHKLDYFDEESLDVAGDA